MAVEVAHAYIAITPKFNGKALSREMGAASQDVASSASKSGSSAFGGMFKKVAGFAATAATAAAGYFSAKKVFGGGLNRLMGIEEAQAKMRGLGHDSASVEKIMANALASVKGTSFGMAEAATTAAGAVAAGIQPGERLEQVLKSVSNSAAAAGVGMDEMGSIYNKVASIGKAQNDVLQQVADKGIPIYQALADQLGVTTDEVFKMASAGKIGFSEFEQAMTTASGTVAAEMGTTLRGSVENLNASLSRIGAGFLQGVFPLIAPMVQKLTQALGPAEDWAKRVGQAFGVWIQNTAVPAAQRLGEWLTTRLFPVLREISALVSGAFASAWQAISAAFSEAGDSAAAAGGSIADGLLGALRIMAQVVAAAVESVGQIVAWLIEWRGVVMPLAAAVGGFIGGLMLFQKVVAVVNAVKLAWVGLSAVFTASPIGLLIAGIAALVAGLVYFFTQTETGKAIVEAAWNGIKAAIGAVVGWWQGTAMPIIEVVWGAIKSAAEVVAAWYQQNLAPVFQAVGELIAAAFGFVAARMSEVWAALQAIWDALVAAWSLVWSAIQSVWDAIGPPLIAVIQAYWQAAVAVLKGLWDNLVAVATYVWNQIKNVVETVLGVIKGIIQAVTAVIRGDWSGAWNAIKGIAETIWNGIKNTIQNAINLVKSIIQNVLNVIKNIWNNALSGILSAVTSKFGEVVSFMRGIPGKIVSALGNVGSLLVNAGKNILGGFLNGLKSGFENVKSFVGGIGSWIASHKGPKAYDLALLVPAGGWIMDGLRAGIEAEIPALRRTLDSVSANVALGVSAPYARPGGHPGGSGPVRVDVSTPPIDYDRLASAIVRAQEAGPSARIARALGADVVGSAVSDRAAGVV